MSLPSKAVFYDENGNEIKKVFCNCGWSYDGVISVYKIFQDWFYYKHEPIEKEIPEDFHTVKIYEEILTKDQFLLFKRLAIGGIILKEMPKKDISSDKTTIPVVNKKFPGLVAEDLINIDPMIKGDE